MGDLASIGTGGVAVKVIGRRETRTQHCAGMPLRIERVLISADEGCIQGEALLPWKIRINAEEAV